MGEAMAAAEWGFEVPTSGTTYLPLAARCMDAFTCQGYGFEASVADLVDNSIDAGVRDVVFCFLRDGDNLVSLLIMDDGQGMTEEELDVGKVVTGFRFVASPSARCGGDRVVRFVSIDSSQHAAITDA